MKEKLFLAGGGNKEDSKLLDDMFAQALREQSGGLVYIPIALDSRKYKDALSWLESIFADKAKEIVMWTNLNDKSLADLEKFGGLYVGGGNTVKLLRDLRTSGFDSVITKFVSNGGVVYGGSAGAIIMGKDIRTAPEAKGVFDTNGLDLVGGHSIVCHYSHNEPSKKALMNLSREIASPIIAIPKKSGVVLSKEELVIVGAEQVYIITESGFDDYSHGQRVEL